MRILFFTVQFGQTWQNIVFKHEFHVLIINVWVRRLNSSELLFWNSNTSKRIRRHFQLITVVIVVVLNLSSFIAPISVFKCSLELLLKIFQARRNSIEVNERKIESEIIIWWRFAWKEIIMSFRHTLNNLYSFICIKALGRYLKHLIFHICLQIPSDDINPWVGFWLIVYELKQMRYLSLHHLRYMSWSKL